MHLISHIRNIRYQLKIVIPYHVSFERAQKKKRISSSPLSILTWNTLVSRLVAKIEVGNKLNGARARNEWRCSRTRGRV